VDTGFQSRKRLQLPLVRALALQQAQVQEPGPEASQELQVPGLLWALELVLAQEMHTPELLRALEPALELVLALETALALEPEEVQSQQELQDMALALVRQRELQGMLAVPVAAKHSEKGGCQAFLRGRLGARREQLALAPAEQPVAGPAQLVELA